MPRGGKRPGSGRPQQQIHIDVEHARLLKQLREQRAEKSHWRIERSPDELVADLIDEEHKRVTLPMRDHTPDDDW